MALEKFEKRSADIVGRRHQRDVGKPAGAGKRTLAWPSVVPDNRFSITTGHSMLARSKARQLPAH
jgi:hypothetical protein